MKKEGKSLTLDEVEKAFEVAKKKINVDRRSLNRVKCGNGSIELRKFWDSGHVIVVLT